MGQGRGVQRMPLWKQRKAGSGNKPQWWQKLTVARTAYDPQGMAMDAGFGQQRGRSGLGLHKIHHGQYDHSHGPVFMLKACMSHVLWQTATQLADWFFYKHKITTVILITPLLLWRLARNYSSHVFFSRNTPQSKIKKRLKTAQSSYSNDAISSLWVLVATNESCLTGWWVVIKYWQLLTMWLWAHSLGFMESKGKKPNPRNVIKMK